VTRVYLPATLGRLAGWAAAASLPAGAACAVTPALREWYASGDAEELEFAATSAAARLALRLLAEDPAAPPRRVVVAADAPDELVEPSPVDGVPGLVRLTGALPWRSVAAVLADDDSAGPRIAAAVRALRAGAVGEPEGAAEVEDAEAEELGWFAVQEVPVLIGTPIEEAPWTR
jgi:hypothetical protein